MKSLILGLLAETSIHPGAGQSAGFVDLPVAREAATDYPVIVGSSMKGALLDRARSAELPDRDTVFGKPDNGGTLLVSDARLLLLPVRSLKTQYKWVTCPHLIERLSRDRCREAETVSTAPPFDWAKLNEHQFLGEGDSPLFLEERQFSPAGPLPNGLIELVKPLIAHTSTAGRLASQLVVISDKDFVWFARYGLAVNARNKLDPDTKTTVGGALWYEESIPPDAVFYCLLAERGAGALAAVANLFIHRSYLQVGGNETIGQGWFAVAMPSTATDANGGVK